MNFEDMQRVWDSQNERPIYAFDEAGLHKLIRRQRAKIEQTMQVFELAMIAISLGMAVTIAAEPILFGHDFHQFIDAVIWLLVAGYLFVGRRRRKRLDGAFDNSLVGDIDKSIGQIDFQIGRLRSFVWWFLLPMSIGAGISFVLLHDSKPIWIWPGVLLSMLIGWLAMRHDIVKNQLPKKRELESLREKLVGESHY